MRNLSIQGLRGIAAIIVFFSHTLLFLNIPQILPIKNSFFHIFFDGQISVMVFIAMSGFFYMKSDSFSFYSYFSVVKKKTIRIFVPYVIAMTFGAILCNSRIDFCMNNFSSWANSFWKTNITLLEYFKQITVVLPHDTHLINPPTWYIPIEVRLFCVIPLVVFIFNLKKIKWLVFVPFLILMLLGFGQWYGACLMGCIMRELLNRYSQKIEAFCNNKFMYVLCFMISIILLNVRNEISCIPDIVAFPIQAMGAALIVGIVFVKSTFLLQNKFVVFMGNISYEFYLVHFIILLAFRPCYISNESYVLIVLVFSIVTAFLLNFFSNIIVKRIKNEHTHQLCGFKI